MVSAEQPLNALLLTVRTVDGRVIVFNPAQFWNADTPISVRLLPSSSTVAARQPLNANSPTFVTPSGRRMAVSLLRFSNAWAPISVTESGMVTALVPVRPARA